MQILRLRKPLVQILRLRKTLGANSGEVAFCSTHLIVMRVCHYKIVFMLMDVGNAQNEWKVLVIFVLFSLISLGILHSYNILHVGQRGECKRTSKPNSSNGDTQGSYSTP